MVLHNAKSRLLGNHSPPALSSDPPTLPPLNLNLSALDLSSDRRLPTSPKQRFERTVKHYTSEHTSTSGESEEEILPNLDPTALQKLAPHLQESLVKMAAQKYEALESKKSIPNFSRKQTSNKEISTSTHDTAQAESSQMSQVQERRASSMNMIPHYSGDEGEITQLTHRSRGAQGMGFGQNSRLGFGEGDENLNPNSSPGIGNTRIPNIPAFAGYGSARGNFTGTRNSQLPGNPIIAVYGSGESNKARRESFVSDVFDQPESSAGKNLRIHRFFPRGTNFHQGPLSPTMSPIAEGIAGPLGATELNQEQAVLITSGSQNQVQPGIASERDVVSEDADGEKGKHSPNSDYGGTANEATHEDVQQQAGHQMNATQFQLSEAQRQYINAAAGFGQAPPEIPDQVHLQRSKEIIMAKANFYGMMTPDEKLQQAAREVENSLPAHLRKLTPFRADSIGHPNPLASNPATDIDLKDGVISGSAKRKHPQVLVNGFFRGSKNILARANGDPSYPELPQIKAWKENSLYAGLYWPHDEVIDTMFPMRFGDPGFIEQNSTPDGDDGGDDEHKADGAGNAGTKTSSKDSAGAPNSAKGRQGSNSAANQGANSKQGNNTVAAGGAAQMQQSSNSVIDGADNGNISVPVTPVEKSSEDTASGDQLLDSGSVPIGGAPSALKKSPMTQRIKHKASSARARVGSIFQSDKRNATIPPVRPESRLDRTPTSGRRRFVRFHKNRSNSAPMTIGGPVPGSATHTGGHGTQFERVGGGSWGRSTGAQDQATTRSRMEGYPSW